jgi:hypothetical protein
VGFINSLALDERALVAILAPPRFRAAQLENPQVYAQADEPNTECPDSDPPTHFFQSVRSTVEGVAARVVFRVRTDESQKICSRGAVHDRHKKRTLSIGRYQTPASRFVYGVIEDVAGNVLHPTVSFFSRPARANAVALTNQCHSRRGMNGRNLINHVLRSTNGALISPAAVCFWCILATFPRQLANHGLPAGQPLAHRTATTSDQSKE